MIKVRKYEIADRKHLEELVTEHFKEIKFDSQSIIKSVEDAVGFFISYPQDGYILIVNFKDKIVGYAIVLYQWRMRYSKPFCYIDEMFIRKQFRKYKPEINIVEYITANDDIFAISVKNDRLNNASRKTMKLIKFDKDSSPLLVKEIN